MDRGRWLQSHSSSGITIGMQNEVCDRHAIRRFVLPSMNNLSSCIDFTPREGREHKKKELRLCGLCRAILNLVALRGDIPAARTALSACFLTRINFARTRLSALLWLRPHHTMQLRIEIVNSESVELQGQTQSRRAVPG